MHMPPRLHVVFPVIFKRVSADEDSGIDRIICVIKYIIIVNISKYHVEVSMLHNVCITQWL